MHIRRFVVAVLVAIFLIAAPLAYNWLIIRINDDAKETVAGMPGDVRRLYFLHWAYFPKEVWKRFSGNHPGITVEYEQIDQENYPKIQKLRMASGDKLDVMGILRHEYRNFVNQGYLADLTGSSLLENYTDEARKEVRELSGTDREYAVAYRDYVYGIWYNKILFNKYGLEVPENYPQFLEVCGRLKANGVTPLITGCRDDWSCISILLTRIHALADFQEDWEKRIRRQDMKWNASPVSVVFEELDRFIDRGYLGPQSLHLTYHQAFMEFSSGRAAMVLTGDWSINMARQDIERVCDPGVFAIPYNEPGKERQVPGSRADFLTGIFKATRNPVDSRILLEYLSSCEAAQLFTDMTISYSTVRDVDVSRLRYNYLWEPLRQAERIPAGIPDTDGRLRTLLKKAIRDVMIHDRPVTGILDELQEEYEKGEK